MYRDARDDGNLDSRVKLWSECSDEEFGQRMALTVAVIAIAATGHDYRVSRSEDEISALVFASMKHYQEKGVDNIVDFVEVLRKERDQYKVELDRMKTSGLW
jgi:predicted exporter